MEIKEKNRSRTYIVPLLNQFIDIHNPILLNSYLYDINNPEINVPNITGILLLMKKTNDLYESRLVESEYVLKRYSINRDYYMLFVKIPLEIAKQVKLILDGKYSKIDDKSKQSILKYWQFGSTTSLYSILYRKQQYKKELEDVLNIVLEPDAELGSVFNLHAETFDTVIKEVELS